MSNLKTYFKNFVSVCKKGFAYVRAISVLVKATYQRMVGDGIYNVSFIKVGRKWYCEVPGFPKELFEHTLMVGGAAKLLDYHARGGKRIAMKVKITNEENGNMGLVKNSSTLTGGAFYNDLSGSVNEEIWLCPVTLFVLGKYPKNIQILEVRDCMPSKEQLEHILYNAIEYCLKDTRKQIEENVVAEFKKAKSIHHQLDVVEGFATGIGYEFY